MLNTMTKDLYFKDEIAEQQECQNCESKDIITDKKRGEMICSQCGLVIEDRLIDFSTEWRAYNNEELEKRARTESPSHTLTNNLSTYINIESKDALGKSIPYENQLLFFRMRKLQFRIKNQNSKDKNLTQANIELDRICSQLQVPRSVKETAGQLYKISFKTGKIRGYPIKSMIAATVYAAARVRRVPRTLDEVSEETQITKKSLAQCYRLIVNRMHFKIPLTRPADILLRIGTELAFSSPTQQLAIEIINEAINKKLTIGKDPSGLAASALYLAGMTNGEKKNQQLIAKVAHVTEVTIRHRYKDLMTLLGDFHSKDNLENTKLTLKDKVLKNEMK